MIDLLSPREIEVLVLIARGYYNTEIAEELVISLDTVKRHIVHIMDKLLLHRRVYLALYAVKERLVDIDDIRLLDAID